MIPGKQYTPELVLGIAWRRKWQILAPTVVIASVVAAVTYNLPNLYRSDTLILVVPQRVPESYVRSTVTTNIQDRLQSISQQILSRTRLESIVLEFDLYATDRRTAIMEDVVAAMRERIAIDIVRGDAFRVTFTGDEPRTTMRVTERLAAYFIDESLRDREVLAQGTSQFLNSQLQDARRRLIENERKLAQYRRLHDGQLPTQVEGNLQGLHNTEMQLQALIDSLNRDRDRHLVLERTLADLTAVTPESESTVAPAPGSGDDSDAEVSATRQLQEAEAELGRMLLRLTPEHPDVVRMRRTLIGLQARVSDEAAAAGAGPLFVPRSPADVARASRLREAQLEFERVARDLQLKEAAETRLRGVITQYQQRIEAAPGRESELAELMRDYSTLQATYSSLLGKEQESQISANLERRQIGEQFRVLDPARLPEKPASPDRPLLYLMGLAGALAVGLVLAGGSEYFDRGLRSEEDVRLALGLPMLAAIPWIPDAGRWARRRSAKGAGGVAAALTVMSVATALAWRSLG